MNQKTVNGHGFFRKSKAYGLVCGIALAGALFVGTGVSADEVTETSATPTTEAVATLSDQNKQMVEAPASAELTNAISNASDTGVTVTQTPTQSVASKADADADYQKQAEEIAAVTKQQEVINQANAETAANNAVLKSAQQDAEAAANATNQAVAQAQTDYPDVTVAEKTVDYGDGSSVDDFNAGKQEVDTIHKANQDAISTYITKKVEVADHNAKVKKMEDDLKNNNLASDQVNGLYVTGDFDTSTTGLAFYKPIKVVTVDPNAKAVKALGWQDNTTIENPSGITVTSHDTANDPAIYGTSSNFLYKVTDTTVGDTFTLKNIGTTTDGVNINAIVTITKASSLTDKEASWFLIGKTKDGGIAVDYWNYDSLGLTFQFVDDASQAIKLVIASVVGDVDNGQTSQIEFDGNTLNYINPDGSGLVANANKSLTGLGFGVDGYQNAPRGTYLMVGSSRTVNYTHTSDSNVIDSNGNIVNYIEFDLFGTSSLVETQEFKYLPDPTLNLTTVTLPPEAVETPLQDHLTVEYHLNQYEAETSTPEQLKLETPIKEAPVAQQAVITLPRTGEQGSWVAVASGLGMATFGLVGIRRKKRA